MNVYETSEIVEYMENVCPISKFSNTSYESIAKKYIDICVSECLKGYINSESDDRIDFRISTLNEHIQNRYNRNQYWLPLLRSNFPFFYTVQQGWKSGEVAVLSSVKPVFNYLACLAHYINTDYSELLTELYPGKGHTDVIRTPIDLHNLQNFMDNIIVTIDDPRYASGVKTLVKQLYQAKTISDMARANDGYLPQQYSIKDTGRTYMSGVNLQNCSSRVREAALGACHKYDLRTSMFAHMLQRIVQQFPDFCQKTSYIAEYIQNKDRVRNQLAKLLVDTQADPDFKVKLIKQMLSAVGFGADVSNPYGAIQKYIWNESDRQRILSDRWMKSFLTEVELYREVMRMSYPAAKQAHGDALRKNGRSSLSKWCSFEYQLTESAIMMQVMNKLGEHNVLLQVHDAIYVKHKCDLIDINWQAHKISPLANFEYERIDAIRYNRQQIAEQQSEAQRHAEFIAQEEQRAKELYNVE